MNEPLQILIADDHAAVRRSIRTLLESRAGWSVCGEASNGREAIEQTRRLRPDVVLLDVSMPEIDGLQATREILQHDPAARVLLLTMYDSAALEEEAALAGARGVVAKPAAHEHLIAAIVAATADSLRLGGACLSGDRHVGAFFRSREEHYDVLAPFVAEGLVRGDKAVHIIEPPTRAEHLSLLQRRGVDLERAEADGRARLISWNDTRTLRDASNHEAALEELLQFLDDGTRDGFRQTRFIAYRGWVLPDQTSMRRLIEFEARVELALPHFAHTVICAYDLTKIDATSVVDLMRAHPVVLLGRQLHDNPYYVPPNDLLREVRGHA
ncbi:MAG TPA: MEDS domain-containing protein [Thermoanaerobaculia bacterium]|nr:MEDS domain-containing protein [Thermoanaerobaculia bacterium]